MDISVQEEQIFKVKEKEKLHKHLDLAKEVKKLWNMKITFVPLVLGGLEMFQKAERKN